MGFIIIIINNNNIIITIIFIINIIMKVETFCVVFMSVNIVLI